VGSTPRINTIPIKGTYTLIISLSKEIRIKVGRLGVRSFPKGYYTYTGSALGTGASSLRRRVSRHLRKTRKKKHWHIDFLLAHRDTTVTAVVAAQTGRGMECELNCYIKRQGVAKIPVSGFGSSDCKGNCQSHLLYFGEEDIKKKIAQLYAEKLGFRPVVIEILINSGVRSPKVSNLSLWKV
jgi:Uri superfamily endonuclease